MKRRLKNLIIGLSILGTAGLLYMKSPILHWEEISFIIFASLIGSCCIVAAFLKKEDE